MSLAPWRRLQVCPVGGLFLVGYAEHSDLLLVLSYQGRGVFDCLTGERLARDRQEANGLFDRIKLTAPGFGPLTGQTVRVAGLLGGGLPLTTKDGWMLEVEAKPGQTHSVLLRSPRDVQPVCVGDDQVSELRAVGFSETGLSFVIATTSDLTMFTRIEALGSA